MARARKAADPLVWEPSKDYRLHESAKSDEGRIIFEIRPADARGEILWYTDNPPQFRVFAHEYGNSPPIPRESRMRYFSTREAAHAGALAMLAERIRDLADLANPDPQRLIPVRDALIAAARTPGVVNPAIREQIAAAIASGVRPAKKWQGFFGGAGMIANRIYHAAARLAGYANIAAAEVAGMPIGEYLTGTIATAQAAWDPWAALAEATRQQEDIPAAVKAIAIAELAKGGKANRRYDVSISVEAQNYTRDVGYTAEEIAGEDFHKRMKGLRGESIGWWLKALFQSAIERAAGDGGEVARPRRRSLLDSTARLVGGRCRLGGRFACASACGLTPKRVTPKCKIGRGV